MGYNIALFVLVCVYVAHVKLASCHETAWHTWSLCTAMTLCSVFRDKEQISPFSLYLHNTIHNGGHVWEFGQQSLMCVPVSRTLTESVGPVPGRSQIKRAATLAFPFFLMDVFVNVHTHALHRPRDHCPQSQSSDEL